MIRNYVDMDSPLVLKGAANTAIKKIFKIALQEELDKKYLHFGYKQWSYNLIQTEPSKNYAFAPNLARFKGDNRKYYPYETVLNHLGTSKLEVIKSFAFDKDFDSFLIHSGSSGNSVDCKVISDVFLCFSNEPAIRFSDIDFSLVNYLTLRISPDSASYSSQESISEFLHYQLKGGSGKVRKDIEGSSKLVNVKWTVGKEGYNYLFAFYEYFKKTLEPFFAELYLSGYYGSDLEPCMCKFVPNSFKLESVKGHTFTVSAIFEVEELTKPSLSSITDVVKTFKDRR